MSTSLEAKIVVLGSQGVGKTSLVNRYVKNAYNPATTVSTIGASFLTKRVADVDTSTVVRLQIWDTAGQERFRSISKLYYRGANAALLCYDITSAASFHEMTRWLLELRQHLGDDIILHVVGTKSDVVAQDPAKRAVPFERCIAYVAEHLHPSQAALQQSATPPGGRTAAAGGGGGGGGGGSGPDAPAALSSPASNRSSGFWGQELGWDCCHEVSAADGEGVDEVFRVLTRKLVEQRNARLAHESALLARAGRTPGVGMGGVDGYFDARNGEGGAGSFRVGAGDKRRSWLGFPTTPAVGGGGEGEGGVERRGRGGRCC